MRDYPRYIYSAEAEKLVYSEAEEKALEGKWFDNKLQAAESVKIQPKVEKVTEITEKTPDLDIPAQPKVKRKRGPNKTKAK